MQSICLYTGPGNGPMNNAEDQNANGCTGNYNGYCKHDMYIRFWNKVGDACNTHWLYNNARWAKGIENEYFTNEGWDCFDWTHTNCVSGWGFYVPNKVSWKNIYLQFR